MQHSPRQHLEGRPPFPQVTSALPQEHVEMVMLGIVTVIDGCTACVERQVSWIAEEPQRMLTLHALVCIFAEGLGIRSYQPAPEHAEWELMMVSRSERCAMVEYSLVGLTEMVGDFLGYRSATGSV